MRHADRAIIVLAAMLLGTLLSRPQVASAAFITANGNTFEVCNQPFRFVGFNVRGICHYGRGDVLPFSSTSHIAASLDYCVAARAKVIRVFCAYRGIGPVETGDRLQVVLDACAARGIWVIVALTDVYVNSNMFPQGDDDYYTQGGCCGLVLLNHAWYQSGYQDHYLPQTLYLADRFRNHPAVFAWQLGNEIRDLVSGATFLNFCRDVRDQIRAVDPNHMISIGLIDSGHAGVSPTQLYQGFDFVGTHNYNGGGRDDSGVAAALNIPYVIDEAGFDSNVYGPDRTGHTGADLTRWIAQRGAEGYLQWGLMASPHDNGDGDAIFGVDQVFHAADYFGYRNLFNTWGSSFENPTSLLVEPPALELTIQRGEVPPSSTFLVSSGAETSFPFAVSETATWLLVAPESGQATCDGEPVEITYQTAALPPGVYETEVVIEAAGVSGSPYLLHVALTVEGFPGDFDGDGDVDLDDHARFQACVGPSGAVQLDPACAPARFDADLDVDEHDHARFLACLSGANIPVSPACYQP